MKTVGLRCRCLRCAGGRVYLRMSDFLGHHEGGEVHDSDVELVYPRRPDVMGLRWGGRE